MDVSKGKEYVLRPMSPSQVIADKQASTHHGENNERLKHQNESERHKVKMSASTISDKKKISAFSYQKRHERRV